MENKIPGPFAPLSLVNRTTQIQLEISLVSAGFLGGILRPFSSPLEGFEVGFLLFITLEKCNFFIYFKVFENFAVFENFDSFLKLF